MISGKSFNFDQEGVAVSVPEGAKRIRAVKLPLDKLDAMPAKPGVFTPTRLVANIALEDENSPGVYLSQFDEPFEMRVRYTPADLKKAQEAKSELKLAFWDGKEWVVFTKKKHNFELQSDNQGGGYGVVQLSRWGDPNISWGA